MTERAELIRALGALCEPPTERTAVLADGLGLERTPRSDEFVETFMLHLYPYASVYLGAEGMLGGEARDRVAGFYRALGITPPPEPDHLATLLGLYASLLEAASTEPDPGRRELIEQARAALLWEHLLSWVGPYLHKMDSAAPPYAQWAALLRAVIEAEVAGTQHLPALPLALREAPGLPDEDADSRTWMQALLAPVRSGMIVTRADLARCARQVGVGIRLGERGFSLRSLLEQDAGAVMEWLASEAASWVDDYNVADGGPGDIALWWAERARHTTAVLQNLDTVDPARL